MKENVKLSHLVATLLFVAFTLTPAHAQSLGNNAVYNSGSTTVGSPAFIDASYYTGTDLCKKLYSVFSSTVTPYPSTGAVIDARGLSTSTACASGQSPWQQGSTYQNKPSTILLPAGTITISYQWVLPQGTKLIGEGVNSDPQTGTGVYQTTIEASSTFPTGTALIEYGSSTGSGACASAGCLGISVENLTLHGNSMNVIGIQNHNAQDQSYADHVKLYAILGTGLDIGGTAQNSGPYSNITFDTGGSFGGTCVELQVDGTRGLQELTCISTSSADAVNLDSSNNSIQNVRIVGFYNGIAIGQNGAAHSDVLLNIYGDTQAHPAIGTPVNVVYISTSNPVSDLSIVGVRNDGGAGTYSIRDTLTSTVLNDVSVGMYVLGETSGSGYTRFTTSQNAATWIVGNGITGGAGCPAVGSLYSDVSSAGAGKLYICTATGWQLVPYV